MPRKRKTGAAEDIVDLVALLPWWAGVLIALASYFVLHRWASPPGAVPVTGSAAGPEHVGAMVVDIMIGTFAYYAQFLVPALCLAGAGVSAWKRRLRGRLAMAVTSNPAAGVLDRMSWREFEMLVSESFRMQGFQVAETGQGGPDGGVDLVLRKDGESYLVQCKQWKAYKVGVEVVRELYGAMAAKGSSGGFVVTSGRFTEPARTFAEGRNLRLIDGTELLRLFQQVKARRSASPRPASAPGQPVIHAATGSADSPSCPRCGKQMVRRVAKQGRNAGTSFWGCLGFPPCTGVRPIGEPVRQSETAPR